MERTRREVCLAMFVLIIIVMLVCLWKREEDRYRPSYNAEPQKAQLTNNEWPLLIYLISLENGIYAWRWIDMKPNESCSGNNNKFYMYRIYIPYISYRIIEVFDFKNRTIFYIMINKLIIPTF